MTNKISRRAPQGLVGGVFWGGWGGIGAGKVFGVAKGVWGSRVKGFSALIGRSLYRTTAHQVTANAPRTHVSSVLGGVLFSPPQ